MVYIKISAITSTIAIFFSLLILVAFVTLIVLIIRALLKYLKSKEVRDEKKVIKRSLGEALKFHRTRCKMTQEFVAETIGVSRQAVSKWEKGDSDPSTSNLFALAKLYGISVEELLKEDEEDENEASSDSSEEVVSVESDDYSIPKSILETANAMYVDEKMKMSSSFDDLADILSNTYQASLKRCDLSSEETMNEINDWVNEKTHGLIPSILDEPMDPGIRMTLLNAVYFKAAWVNAFEKELTDKQIFHGKEGDTSVDMMHQQDHFEYAENDEYQMIRLPYHGGCEMTVYLPKDSTAADKWSEKDYLYQLGLEADKQEWDRREVSLSMPKFEMEYGNELKDILKELGLEGIFDGCIYDRLTDAEMAVGSIYHKTAIKNDENGTEAAAVTMMLMEAMALLPEDDIVEMNMDHPFYFTISNTETGLKLFEGCVYNLK